MTAAAHTSLPSLDDIVFEGRNKAYGAYVLRQVYGRHVTKAVALAIALAGLLIAVPVVVQRLWPAVVVVPPPPVVTPTILTSISDPEPPRPQQASHATVTVRRHEQPTTPTKVVRDEDVKTPDKPEVEVPRPAIDGPVAIGPVETEGNGGSSTQPGLGDGNDSAASSTVPAVTKPFVHVEEMPEFMGGNAALMKYLQRQMKYPPQALRAGVEGKVFISFTVNTDGSIDDVEVLKGLGYGTDEEASRVIGRMPAWKPGYQNHHAVPVRYTLPITFKYE